MNIEEFKSEYVLREIDAIKKMKNIDGKTVELLLEAMNHAFFVGFNFGQQYEKLILENEKELK